jgi:hypothetical protein
VNKFNGGLAAVDQREQIAAGFLSLHCTKGKEKKPPMRGLAQLERRLQHHARLTSPEGPSLVLELVCS